MSDKKTIGIGFIIALIVVFVVGFVIYGFVTVSSFSSPTNGQHTVVITAVEQNGFFWKTWRVYVKTGINTSQENQYCVIDPTVLKQLQDAQVANKEVTITYSNPIIIRTWDCGTGIDSIIRSVK